MSTVRVQVVAQYVGSKKMLRVSYNQSNKLECLRNKIMHEKNEGRSA